MSKNSTTQSVRAAGRKLFALIAAKGKQGMRALGELIGRSKSSVCRHIKAQERRDQHPESAFWETEAGAAWLRLMVFAVLYSFGLQNHVGAESLSNFFKLIRIDTHVGVSPNALLTLLKRMETLLPEFQRQCEASAPKENRECVLAADETFFGQIMILVLMDLSSGYLLLESIQDNRTFDTWFEQAEPRLKALGIDVKHAISDRAKALIKLAVTGFECDFGADLFHEQYGISRWLSPVFGRRKTKADKKCKEAENALKTVPSDASAEDKAILDAQLADAKKEQEHTEKTQQMYQEQLQGIADEVHPFSPEENVRITADCVAAGLEKRAQSLENLAKQEGIADNRSALKKFRNQISALSSHVTVWWKWVEEMVREHSADPATQQWLILKLLPVLYWHHQMQTTQSSTNRRPPA